MQRFEVLPRSSVKPTESQRIPRPALATSKKQRGDLGDWLTIEIMDGFASRTVIEDRWREALRMYEGLSKKAVRDFPYRNAPNFEVPLGAIASDAIYSQMIDLIFQISPIITVRPTGKAGVKDAKAFQRWINWGVENQYKIREPFEHALLDDCQLGTGIVYSPYVKEIVRRKNKKTIYSGPRMIAIPVEDYLTPGGAGVDQNVLPWVAVRFYYSEYELNARAKEVGWDISTFQRCGNVGTTRWTRERLGGTQRSGKRLANLYEIMEIYCHYDIDGDGIEEDLYVVWDKTSRSIGYVDWAPYDTRPFSILRYQPRAHLFYGIGVMEMLRTLEYETTEIHCARVANMILANTRMWKSKTGSVPEDFEVWPNRNVEMDNPEDLQGEQLSDIYPSAGIAEEMDLKYAEQRVGLNQLSQPSPSQVLGSRTPGITAMQLAGQSNKRFASAFDSARLGLADAVKQCLYREHEQLMAGNIELRQEIERVLGDEDAQRVTHILTDPRFAECFTIELTASSASINREADKQSSLQLAQLLMAYYEKAISLSMLLSNPQMPESVRKIGEQAMQKATELMDRTLRTFDLVRDPQSFLLEVDNAESEMGRQFAGLDPATVQAALAGLAQGGSPSDPRGAAGANPLAA